jgi:uncharacterized delta-60 repeat protein
VVVHLGAGWCRADTNPVTALHSRILRRVAVCCVAAGCLGATLGGSGVAATSSTVVSATVPSATSLSAAGCATGVADRTHFGTVTAGSAVVTGQDCTITFGSSNDTARLRIQQTDALGVAMFQPSRGALDPTFDGDGRVTTATAPAAGGDWGMAAVVQTDGRIVIAGHCQMGGATGTDFCLARYNASGSLDTSFDGDGRVTTAIAPTAGTDLLYGVALQSDGKIVTAGACDMGGATGRDACLARYNTDGSLDTSFDGDGRVTTATAILNGQDYPDAVAIQADGKIITAGQCDMGATDYDACLARYNVDGSLDTSFDGDGRVTTAAAPGDLYDGAYALALQADGRIVTAGECEIGGGTWSTDVCLARYNVDGSLDTSFDGNGQVTTAIAPATGDDAAFAVAVQPDGKIVTAGYCDMGGATGTDACLARYNPNGTLDTSFDTDGRVTTATAPATGNDFVYAIALQADGKIITAGQCAMGGATGQDECLARYNTDGSLDTTFDTDGRVTTATAPGAGSDRTMEAMVHADGRIVTAGSCDMGGATGMDACLASYDNGGLMSQYANGVTDWSTSGTSHLGVCLRSVANATAAWTTSPTCPATSGAYWNAISTTAGQVAATATGVVNGTANLRFGLRVSATQPSGTYIAPVTFTVAAP